MFVYAKFRVYEHITASSHSSPPLAFFKFTSLGDAVKPDMLDMFVYAETGVYEHIEHGSSNTF